MISSSWESGLSRIVKGNIRALESQEMTGCMRPIPGTVTILQKEDKTMKSLVSKRHMPVIVRVLLGLFLAPIVVVAGFLLVSIVWMRATHIQWVREKYLRYNKEIQNPAALKQIAEGRSSMLEAIVARDLMAAVKHVGRRSGQSYTTPVGAMPLLDGFVIPLVYGSSVDWCRNVLAAGTCTLIWKKQAYTLERPEIIHQSQALKAFPFVMRVLYPGGGVKEYLWLHERKEVPETAPVEPLPQPIGAGGR